MDDLTINKIKEYREVFEFFDRDKDGSINYRELSEVMKHLINDSNQIFINSISQNKKQTNNLNSLNSSFNSNLSDSFYKELISENDIDGNDKLDFEEFVILMYRKNKKATKIREELQNAFKTFDKNNDNKISHEELTHVLTALENKLTEEQIKEILDELDPNKNGYLNYLEFVELLLNN